MGHSKKAIITCAITGSLATPGMSPYLPITPDQIADEAVKAAEAGAAIIHLHARRYEEDENYGYPDWRPETYMRFLPRIKRGCNAIVNITTGGGAGMNFDQRLAGPVAASPELASFNCGSCNFGVFSIAHKIKELAKYDWEVKMLMGSKEHSYINTWSMMESVAQRLGRDCGTRFEFECFDLGHLYALRMVKDLGWLPNGPVFVQAVFGVPGGMSADLQNVLFMHETATRLFGDDLQMSNLGAGRFQMRIAAMSGMMGCHVRVGLEDSLVLGKGELAKSNADQVHKVRRILKELSIEIATPDEARELLQTKGSEKVAF